MQLSKTLLGSAILLAGALALARADYQGASYPDSQRAASCHNCPGSSQYGPAGHNAASNYGPASGSSNNNNYNSNSNNKAYGPYHSYAVRPAVYGGHRLYHYQGYARHYANKQHQHQRQHPRACGGYNCNQQAGLRQVNALVLAPAYGSGYGNYLPARHQQSRHPAHRPRHGRSRPRYSHAQRPRAPGHAGKTQRRPRAQGYRKAAGSRGQARPGRKNNAAGGY